MDIWLKTNLTAHGFVKKEYWDKNFSKVKAAIPNSKLFVYEEDNIIKGFIGIIGNYIAGLFVREEFQNNKIGKRLLENAQALSQDLSLDVFSKNEKAVKFYKRNGFKIIYTRKNPKTKQNEHVMFWKKANISS
jgi:putative acetyltransferase